MEKEFIQNIAQYGVGGMSLMVVYALIHEVISPLLKRKMNGKQEAATSTNVDSLSKSVDKLIEAISMMANQNHTEHREILLDTNRIKDDVNELRKAS